MTILPKCPSCGLESAEIRCPRCNTLKLIGCSGACASCAASCPSAASSDALESANPSPTPPTRTPSDDAAGDSDSERTPIER